MNKRYKIRHRKENIEQKENDEFVKAMELAIQNSLISLEKDLTTQETKTLNDSFIEMAIENVAKYKNKIKLNQREKLIKKNDEETTIKKEEDDMIEWDKVDIEKEEQEEQESEGFDNDWKQTPELWGNYNDFVEVE